MSPAGGGRAAGPEELTGRVERRITGAGSKSQMASVVLVPDEPLDDDDAHGVLLRRRHATSLDAEPALLAHVGQHVRVVGNRGWAVFLVDDIEEIDRPTSAW